MGGGRGQGQDGSAPAEDRTIIFFLGAVKDMTAEESKEVTRACRLHEVPFFEANLGQQAEFTSKIIDVLHGHHVFGRLVPAVWRLVRRTGGGPEVAQPVRDDRPPRGTLWVVVPVAGCPRDLQADDYKRDGVYEVPRCLISQLWCSKNEHSGHVISFVFASGEVVTAYPTLVTCLKMQHRAAPTERNLVSALRVSFGDQRADPSLVVDKGCVTLRKDAADLAQEHVVTQALDASRTALVDLQMGGTPDSASPLLDPYGDGSSSVGRGPRDMVVLLRQSGGRDFPKGFREKFVTALQGEGAKPADKSRQKQSLRLQQLTLPRLSVNASISVLAHHWQTGALSLAVASAQRD